MTDAEYMRIALSEARLAAAEGEVPVGAVLLRGGTVLAQAHNRVEQTGDPTAHAELLCLQAAAAAEDAWRMADCTLYVTLEPCAMCAGALVNARLGRLVFGAFEPRCKPFLRGNGHRARCWGRNKPVPCTALKSKTPGMVCSVVEKRKSPAASPGESHETHHARRFDVALSLRRMLRLPSERNLATLFYRKMQ